ncbi:MAG: hypothetical protein M3136_06985 [Thermoproteota archaeon]|nr:hypothetical protein [Thermoproteota archaeon]
MNRLESVVSHVDRVLFPVTSRKAAIVISAVIIALLSLILFSVRQNILTYDNTLETVYFILTVVIAYGIGSWFLLGYVKQASRAATSTTTSTGSTVYRGPLISLLHLAVVIVQFTMLGIMLYVIFDRTSEYLMPYVNAITSGFATIILGAFAYKFAKWYKLSNKKLVVLLYFLTVLTLAIMIAADLALKYVITTTVEESAPGEVSREDFIYRDFEGGQLLKQDIEPDYTISYIVPLQFLAAWSILNNYPGLFSFIFRWGATSITLNQYNRNRNKRINQAVFWAMISIPLIIYILGKSPDLFNLDPEPWTRPLFRGGNIAIGIMFGLAFLLMARRVPAVKDYLTLAAIGVMIISVAFSVTNMQQTFGIAAHSLVLLSSYLFAIGLYYAAISISNDAALRKSIRTSISNSSSDLLQSAGLAETQQQIEKEVLKLAKNQSDNLLKQTGVRPSMEEEDVKNYLEEILPKLQRSAERGIG